MEPGKTEQQVRDYFEDAACGLAQTDDSGLFLRVNRLWCDWTGYRADELVGKRRLQDLLSMGARIFHQTHWSPLLQMQGSLSEVKLEVLHREGKKVPMVMNAIRRERDGGYAHDIAAFVARDRDLYERELLASRVQIQEAAAEARNQAKFAEQMIGIVSHDLRNPLSTIQMGAMLLARANPTANQLGVLGRVSRASDRAIRLVADLLDFTRARLGKGVAVSPKWMDLKETVADALDELALAYPEREITRGHVGPIQCFADGDRLAQLLGNLVSNAMAYGDPAKPVTVQSVVAGDGFSIAVTNQGPLISEELKRNMFQPMVRGVCQDESRSVGLGLFIVFEIAKAHGGTVSVESTELEGTTFKAWLPSPVTANLAP